jgi:glycerol kinase
LTSVIQHSADRTEFVLEGTVNGAGAAIEWLANSEHRSDLFQQLPVWLSEVTEHDILFLNGVSGLGSPFWVADFASCFVGSADIRGRAIAVAESIIFLLQSNLDELQKLASPPDLIQLTGGLSKWDGLARRLANLSGLPVYRPRECEATGRGLAFLLADRPSHWPEQEPGDWFEPEDDVALKRAYQAWRTMMLKSMRQG